MQYKYVFAVCDIYTQSSVSSETQVFPAGQKLHYLLTINLKEGRKLAIRDRSGKHVIML